MGVRRAAFRTFVKGGGQTRQLLSQGGEDYNNTFNGLVQNFSSEQGTTGIFLEIFQRRGRLIKRHIPDITNVYMRLEHALSIVRLLQKIMNVD